MPPSERTPGFEKKNRSSEDAELGAVLRIAGSDERDERDFESEIAADVIAEMYPQLLENCTDEDDEIDTRAAFEVLAGMVGLFIAEYQEYYGHEKAMGALQELIDLSLNLYEDRVSEEEA